MSESEWIAVRKLSENPMHMSLVQAEIRRALAKAAWYSEHGESQQALAYWGYAKRLEGYPPEIADRLARETLDELARN